ncbi:MAG TPA: tRNA (N6-threonylcarbamoyladenosine(37)-N6)-methyltransferase TrmO [Victivallales bacterium]|nr:tRNA (N6-threonylcarbamoyladenosine(37)-N6)-methyltransferase TrmO [Victivallales bacterium]HPO89877.1 tRNA (N6-threonylcarbamoyladenosine(37)-N6)-methyltransferase TrmO [Victivallales bacterium]HRR29370.1 tRNA (N6-threonylcarbamoyladenosine(37)-N6)-methyltransferase TrmO [Victivallales bacterium]HRU00499.1 tRNA (N6-threonylcarbamoyladenosine(37)-N6)-methyltransferase TrmO [Victivallales bacterium]
MKQYIIKPIGIIRTPHKDRDKTPIQPRFAFDIIGKIELFQEYTDGLRDLDKFSHIYLLYIFNRENQVKLNVKPFLQDIERGIFATRAPCRPNHIGLSIVRLLSIQNNILEFSGADILDNTPLIDIKPYTRLFDCIENTKNGWQDELDKDEIEKRGRKL